MIWTTVMFEKRRTENVELELPEEELDKLGEGQILIPGMPVTAFIRTQDRTPLAYLLTPLTTYFDRAFRDS